MLRFSIWVISLLTLFSTISTEDSILHNKLPHYASNDQVYTSRTGRFGFGILDNLHKQFCETFCMSAHRQHYPINLLFILKCPEWYFSNCSKTTTTTSPPVQTITTSTEVPMTGPPFNPSQTTVGPIASNPTMTPSTTTTTTPSTTTTTTPSTTTTTTPLTTTTATTPSITTTTTTPSITTTTATTPSITTTTTTPSITTTTTTPSITTTTTTPSSTTINMG